MKKDEEKFKKIQEERKMKKKKKERPTGRDEV